MSDDLIDLALESVVVRSATDGRITRWNPASESLYGIAAVDAVGKRLCSLVCDEPDGTALKDAFAALAATGEWSGELRRKNANGTSLIVAARWIERPSPDGGREVVECALDLTERRATEARLQHSESRYDSLFSAMAAAFWELDFTGLRSIMRRLREEGVTELAAYLAVHPEVVREMMRATRVIDVNVESVALFGRGRREDLFRCVEDFWPEESTADFAAAAIAGIERKASFSTETRLRRPDGTTFDALFTVSYPADVFEKGIFVVGVIDITVRKRVEAELRRNEDRYRRLFHLMPIPLVQLDVRGLIARYEEIARSGVEDLATWLRTADIASLTPFMICRAANQKAIELFGASTEEEVLGPIDWVWRLSPETLRRSFVARLRGDSMLAEETRVLTRDGRTIDVYATITYPPELADQGLNIVAFVDIRDRLQSQEQLAQMQREYAHAARIATLGELGASIAHEVNQPLSAILTTAATIERWLARQPPRVDEARTTTARLASEARRASEIVGRVRALAGKGATLHTRLGLSAIVEEAVEFLRYDIKQYGVEVVFELDGELVVIGDRVELQQVIVNLSLNAVQAMQSAPRRILRVQCEAVDTDTVQLAFLDTGPGIAAADEPHLFMSFYTTKKSGVGIGLRICRSIIETHGGTVTAANRTEGGAAFTVRLPRAR